MHVCTSAACSAATIGFHSVLYCGEFESEISQLEGGFPMVGHAFMIDCLSSVVVVIADCNDVHAFVTLPFEPKAAEICLADAVSGTSVLEKEESDTCGAESHDRLVRNARARAHAVHMHMHTPWLHRLAVAGLQRTGGGVGGTKRRLGRVERG